MLTEFAILVAKAACNVHFSNEELLNAAPAGACPVLLGQQALQHCPSIHVCRDCAGRAILWPGHKGIRVLIEQLVQQRQQPACSHPNVLIMVRQDYRALDGKSEALLGSMMAVQQCRLQDRAIRTSLAGIHTWLKEEWWPLRICII